MIYCTYIDDIIHIYHISISQYIYIYIDQMIRLFSFPSTVSFFLDHPRIFRDPTKWRAQWLWRQLKKLEKGGSFCWGEWGWAFDVQSWEYPHSLDEILALQGWAPYDRYRYGIFGAPINGLTHGQLGLGHPYKWSYGPLTDNWLSWAHLCRDVQKNLFWTSISRSFMQNCQQPEVRCYGIKVIMTLTLRLMRGRTW